MIIIILTILNVVVAGFNQTEFFLLEDSFFVYLEFAISEGTIRRPTEFVITSTDGESGRYPGV